PTGSHRPPGTEARSRPELLVVLDCETRLTPEQALTFGSARAYRRPVPRFSDSPTAWEWFGEYLFYDAAVNSDELAVLEAFMAGLQQVTRFDPLWDPKLEEFTTRGLVVRTNESGVPTFLLERGTFVKNVLRPLAVKGRA